MQTSDLAITLILSEISALLLLALTALLLVLLLKKRKQSKLLYAMLQRATNNEESRKSSLRSVFSKGQSIDNQLLDDFINEVVSKELSFYQLISDAVVSNKIASIQELDSEVHKLVSPYERLAAVKSSSQPSNDVPTHSPEDEPIFDDALEDLLSDEPTTSTKDPEFDLSSTEADDVQDLNQMDIAEIPESLLGESAPPDDDNK